MRAAAAFFSGASPLAREPVLREYLADLVAPYGLALREDLLAAGAGQSYGEMGEQLISGLVDEDDPVDLLVLAVDIPDVRPGRSTALYLSSVCPGRPDAFAVSDQGTASPFTAIRLAGLHLGSAEYRSALVLVLEQTALHYEPLLVEGEPGPALPARHAGVALRFKGDGTPRVSQYTDMAPSAAIQMVADRADEQPAVFVLGQGLADATFPGEVLCTEAQPLTGVWAAYAEHGEQWAAERRRVVLADYDLGMRTLSLCVFEGART